MTSRQRLERTTKTAMPTGQPVKYPTTRRVAYTIFSLSQFRGRSRSNFLVLGLLSSEVYDSCRLWIRRRSAGGDFSSR
jgi:hypothetical protein